MHFRGCSGVPNRLLRSYHSGETGDIDQMVRTLSRRFPDRPLFALGYSLGGNALLKWLGEQGEAAPLRAAVAVSVPFDLAIAAQTMARGLSRIYQRHLLRKLHRSARAKLGYPGFPVTQQELARLTSFRSFDDRITAPIHGFRGVDDYYASASCRAFLHRIRIPTLILHARDDPFMTPAAIPQDPELSPQVQLELSDQGGHVGFVSGSPTSPEYYLERRIPEFIHASA
jgi:predicted alpha/beta-fold hydrolase